MSKKGKHTLGSLVFLAVGIAVAALLILGREQTPRTAPPERSEVVQTVAVKRQLVRLDVTAQGTVLPAQEIILQPRVSGTVIELSDALTVGGRVQKGDLLLRIDTADYELALARAQTALADAQAKLALETGRREIAKREWALFADELPVGERDGTLALREPQTRAAEAAVAAAQANVRDAQLALERTQLRAPFNAYVREEAVDLGQTVNPQSRIATLVGTDRFWVRASVAAKDLAVIDVADDAGGGASAEITFDYGHQIGRWEGRVVRRLADLQSAGQLARVMIEVPRPLDDARAPLLLDSFVNVRIATRDTRALFEIDRLWLRPEDQLYVYADGVLDIRDVDVVWRRPDSVLVDTGLADGDLVVTTPLSRPLQGSALRRADSERVAQSP